MDMNIMKMTFYENYEPYSLELEESVQQYIFDKIIRPNKDKEEF